MTMTSCRKIIDHLVLFPKAKCEEDVDLFREVMYTLLGLMMNLCLQSPSVSEVPHSFLPTLTHSVAKNCSHFCKEDRSTAVLLHWQWEWGMLGGHSVPELPRDG